MSLNGLAVIRNATRPSARERELFSNCPGLRAPAAEAEFTFGYIPTPNEPGAATLSATMSSLS